MAYMGEGYKPPAWMNTSQWRKAKRVLPVAKTTTMPNMAADFNAVSAGEVLQPDGAPIDIPGDIPPGDTTPTTNLDDIVPPGLFDGGQVGSPTARNIYRPARKRFDWRYDPYTGKPIGETAQPETTPTDTAQTKTTASAYDFWGKLRELMDDPTDKMADETWQSLVDLYTADPKWKAPTSAAAQRLLQTAIVFKNMGYDAEQLMPLVEKALEMGYSTPKFSLSLFNRILAPYGLGTSSK